MWVQVGIIVVALWLVYITIRRQTMATSAYKKIGLVFLAVGMVVAVLNPGVFSTVAEWAGIGRGTDLLLYGLTAAFIVYALSQYLRNGAQRDVTYRLARQIALEEARRRYGLS